MHFFEEISITEFDRYIDIISSCNSDANKFVLQNSDIPVQERAWLAMQIKCRKKAEKKHPDFYEKGCFYTEKAIEQSTSFYVAKEKVKLIKLSKNGTVCDLTGGLGAETIAFAAAGMKVHYIEPDKALFQISSYNFSKFVCSGNIVLHNTNAEQFLVQNQQHFDLVMLDPDRRVGGTRNFTLENSSPNPILLENQILNISTLLWVKHSPLIDIDYLKKTFKSLQTVFVISLRNEVKEVSSLHSQVQHTTTSIICLCIDSKGDAIKIEFEENDRLAQSILVPECDSFFFEPDKAIIKSGCADAYANKKQLKSVSKAIPYYTASTIPAEFAGRVFKLRGQYFYSEKSLKTFLKTNAITKASVGARGFPIKANEIESKFRLKPDDTTHLFFYLDKDGLRKFIWCEAYLPKASI